MERLTVADERLSNGKTRSFIIDSREVEKHAMEIYWHLKKYKDTGVKPENLQATIATLRLRYANTKGMEKSIYGEILSLLGINPEV